MTETSGGLWLAVWTLTVREVVRFFRQRSRLIGALGQTGRLQLAFGLLLTIGLAVTI